MNNHDELVKRLKEAEKYFLNIANDLADPEALHAECCYRSIVAIESLESQVKELESDTVNVRGEKRNVSEFIDG